MVVRSILAALVVAGVAVPAVAQGTRAQADARLAAEFRASDTNRDGVLSRAEAARRFAGARIPALRLTPAQKTRLTALWFARADADGDGRLTRGEAQAAMGDVFRRYDRDGDGRIAAAERSAAIRENRPGR